MSRISTLKRSSTLRAKFRARVARTRPPCHLCGEPIDWDAPAHTPLSFERDHVIPLGQGGLDTIENSAAAHRKCNNAKRDKVFAVGIVRTSGALQ